jgi:hypothetical protein
MTDSEWLQELVEDVQFELGANYKAECVRCPDQEEPEAWSATIYKVYRIKTGDGEEEESLGHFFGTVGTLREVGLFLSGIFQGSYIEYAMHDDEEAQG